jgi:DNA polymerase III alpha subunit (gram-positive type)
MTKPADRKFVFLDVETTGLSPTTDNIVELSYAIDDGPIVTLNSGVKRVSEAIDNLIKFTERGLADKPPCTQADVDVFLEETKGHTMVAANPAFDASFLKERDLWTMSYRMLDIESYGMAKLKLDYVPGMAELHETLTKRGYRIPKPDHSSEGDVRALRMMFNILRYQF